MGFQYSYLLTDLGFLLVWAALFAWRKDVRKEMIILSVIFGIVGLIAQPIHINDWWKPLTITNTSVGIEDFLYGFGVGGIAAVIYEEIFKKRIRMRKAGRKKELKREESMALFISLFLILFAVLFYVFQVNTFIGATLLLSIGTLFMWAKRHDIIVDSVASGILIMLISFAVYSVTEIITPGWVKAFWYFQNVPNIIIFNVPIDDVVWFFLAGAFIGPLYEFWQEGRIVNEDGKRQKIFKHGHINKKDGYIKHIPKFGR